MATLFGRALTAGRGWMHIAIVMALFVTIFIRKSRRSRTQAVGSEKQAIITVLKNRYWLIVKKYKKEAGKKVPFLIWVKRKAERRRSICDWLCPAFLNAVLLSQSIQDLTQIYGQSAIFGWFVRKQNAFYGQTGIFQWFVRKFLAIMMMIYGQKPLFGAFVRKSGSETSEFLRTNGCFWPFCP